jgi:organic hydroperoxide reductase OsmC/OhrA
MTIQEIAAAIERVESVMRRRPELGMHDDAAALVTWEGGLRACATDGSGLRLETDMPTELGGSGDRVFPGWLMRAGAASCALTRIAMEAASNGLVLDALQVSATSRSDTRGLLGMSGDDGQLVFAGPAEVVLQVQIAAAGVDADRLRGLVEHACRSAPVQQALAQPTPVKVQVHVGGS